MNKILHQLKFEYEDNVLPDKERERFLTSQASIWFDPLVDKINSQSGTVTFFLKEGVDNHVYFEGIDSYLSDKMYERLKMFQLPRPQ